MEDKMELSEEINFEMIPSSLGMRLLAGGEVKIDYTVFGMVLFTMVLLFIVGVLRHKIDHWAKGNTFCETVLEACYHELSTLGTVEAVVFILHKYYKGLNIQVEMVFAEVHFTLFFVVIINAIMSMLLFLLASRVANRQWVRIEAIDLDHYVAVRKQYDDVNRKLEALEVNQSMRQSRGDINNRSKKNDHQRQVSFEVKQDDAGNKSKSQKSTLEETSPAEQDDETNNLVWRFWNYNVTKHLLKRKQHELLVQVRFHELRVHFIESHHLPPNFRVAEYLKLCMSDEFKNLVHVSYLSWGILIFVTNLIYFAMGILYAVTEDNGRIAIALTSFYLGYAIIFVIISSVVFVKMKQVFLKIVKDDSWIEAITERENDVGALDTNLDNLSSRTVQEFKDFNQNDYFWGSNPSIVVTMAQLMQFGYAISFGVLLVFNNNLKLTESRNFWFGWYPIIPFVCYVLYLALWCKIMPKYTQCTSLGRLVQKQHLIEVDAISKLSKAKTRRQEEIDNLQAEKEVSANLEARSKRQKKPRQRQRQDSLQTTLFRKFIGLKYEEESDVLDDSRQDGSLNQSERLRKLSAFVKEQTANLPDENLIRRRRDRRRTRSVSDGVAAMRLFSTTSALAQQALSTSALAEVDDREVESMKGTLESLPRPVENIKGRFETLPRQSGRRKKMVSTGVFFMQSEKSNPFSDEVEQKKIDSPTLTDHADKKSDVTFGSAVLDQSKFSNNRLSIDRKNSESIADRPKLTPVLESDVNKIGNVHKELDDDLSIDSEEQLLDQLDDGLSIESGESVELREGTRLLPIEAEEPVSFKGKLQQIFLHKSYHMYSALFGTMPIFFFMSFRIETVLIETCVMKDNENTWDLLPSRRATFWFTVIWFCVLLVESLTICLLFGWKKTKLNREMFAQAVFDIILTTICLSLFLWAEVSRCCECYEENDILKAEPDDPYGGEYGGKYGGCTIDNQSKCCPSFGTRLCGGLGTIEPFASLIALRLFRIFIARLLLLCFQQVHKLISKDHTLHENMVLPMEDHLQEEELRRDEEKENDIELKNKIIHQTGTIAELWVLALTEYPEIVKEHGIFSGLLLEAMLGIDALPKDEKTKSKQSESEDAKKEKMFSLESHTDVNAGNKAKPTLKRGISTMSLHSGGGNSISDLNKHDNNFIRPGAPLIRSMRRCECKWEWLKSAGTIQWDIVDVVLTECEIVWFNATANPTYWDDAEQKRVHNIQKAIIAKKGGKSLRLSDIAAGREVLGRMALSDIDNIKINRFAPCASSVKANEGNATILDLEESRAATNKEFWLEGHKINLPLEKQWLHVTEDRLKLHSKQGTLSLRFFVDLYEVPVATRDEMQRKKGALLWCESISHLCGKSQLKQKLPHFGEDRDHELKDFIEYAARHKGWR